MTATDRPPHPRASRNEILGLGAATVVTFVVAAAFVGRKEFWLDESFSYVAARRSWGDIVSFAFDRSGELNMALYFLVLKPIATVTASAWLLRLPSTLAVIATVPLVWLVADRIDGRRFVRVAATVLMLTQAVIVQFAFEARAYGLLMLLTVGLTYLLLRALSGSTAAGVAYAVLLPVGVVLHLLVAPIAVAQFVAIVVVTQGPWVRRFLRASVWAGPGLLVAAVLGLLLVRFQGNLENTPDLSPFSFASTVHAVTGRAGPLTLLVLAALVAGVVGVARSSARPHLGWVLVLTVAVPPVLQLAASLSRPLFSARYLVHLVPLLCCLAAIGLATALAKRQVRIAALATFAVLGLIGQAVVYRAPSDEIPDSATAFILERSGPADIVAFNSPYAQLPFQRYLDATGATGPRQVDVVVDPASPLRNTVLQPFPAAVAGLDDGATVWILFDRASAARSAELEATLREDGFLGTEQQAFGEIGVRSYRRP